MREIMCVGVRERERERERASERERERENVCVLVRDGFFLTYLSLISILHLPPSELINWQD